MKVSVKVTPEDITLGTPNNSSWCPVARAIRREIPNIITIDVDCSTIEFEVLIDGVYRRYWVPTPEKLEDFIENFDTCVEGISPFETEIEVQESDLNEDFRK